MIILLDTSRTMSNNQMSDEELKQKVIAMLNANPEATKVIEQKIKENKLGELMDQAEMEMKKQTAGSRRRRNSKRGSYRKRKTQKRKTRR